MGIGYNQITQLHQRKLTRDGALYQRWLWGSPHQVGPTLVQGRGSGGQSPSVSAKRFIQAIPPRYALWHSNFSNTAAHPGNRRLDPSFFHKAVRPTPLTRTESQSGSPKIWRCPAA